MAAAATASISVDSRSPAMNELAESWPVLDALNGGTPAMRKAGRSLLPQWPAEEATAYDARLATATLFPAYQRTVGVMAGKPFAKALTLTGAAQTVERWADDIDLQGNSLHVFASDVFTDSFYGLAGILVEYPRVGPAPNGVRTVAAVEAAGLRPYMVRIHHDQILGWRTGQVGGKTILTQLRLREDTLVDDGEYGTKYVQRVRVLSPGAFVLLELRTQSGGQAAWVEIDKGTTSLPYIPFVPVYGKRRGFMDGVPPLLDLAYLNVKHWQSQSDQDTILHAARVPILALIGADDNTQLVVGGSTAVKLPMAADMKWVEHSGAAIGAGKESLADLEGQMIQTGAELLVKAPGARSATEASGDMEANKSELQRMTEQVEDALDRALVFMAAYGNVPPEQAGSVSLFKDFGAATMSDASAQLVADLNSRGLLTKETTLREMQRRGVIEASVDVEVEIDKAADEGPALGEIAPAEAPPPARKKTRITRDQNGDLIASEE